LPFPEIGGNLLHHTPMNIQTILRDLENLFRTGQYAEVEPYLLTHLKDARTQADQPTQLTLLNELMGFYRSVSRFADALNCAKQAVTLMDSMGLQGSVHYATTLLNVATAYRAAGQTAHAIDLFGQVQTIYTTHHVQDAYLLGSLYNNLSLAHQEAGDHAKAIDCLSFALPLAEGRTNSTAEVAVTLTNLALSRIQLNQLDQARTELRRAMQLFESLSRPSAHYSAALAALGGIAHREGNTLEAVACFERALADTQARYGKNINYAMTLESLGVVLEHADPTRSQTLLDEADALFAALQADA